MQQYECQVKKLTGKTEQLDVAVTKLVKHSDIALGRNRNVVVKGIEEPFCRNPKQREREIRHHIINLLRIAGLPGHILLKRVLRLGKWKTEGNLNRPVLIEFGNPRYRDLFLSAAGKIEQTTHGKIVIEPDVCLAARKQSGMSGQNPDPRSIHVSSSMGQPCMSSSPHIHISRRSVDAVLLSGSPGRSIPNSQGRSSRGQQPHSIENRNAHAFSSPRDGDSENSLRASQMTRTYSQVVMGNTHSITASNTVRSKSPASAAKNGSGSRVSSPRLH